MKRESQQMVVNNGVWGSDLEEVERGEHKGGVIPNTVYPGFDFGTSNFQFR